MGENKISFSYKLRKYYIWHHSVYSWFQKHTSLFSICCAPYLRFPSLSS